MSHVERINFNYNCSWELIVVFTLYLQICQKNDDNAERDKLKQFNTKHCPVQGNYVGMLYDHERACQCM